MDHPAHSANTPLCGVRHFRKERKEPLGRLRARDAEKRAGDRRAMAPVVWRQAASDIALIKAPISTPDYYQWTPREQSYAVMQPRRGDPKNVTINGPSPVGEKGQAMFRSLIALENASEDVQKASAAFLPKPATR
jgi:hypothetical protein